MATQINQSTLQATIDAFKARVTSAESDIDDLESLNISNLVASYASFSAFETAETSNESSYTVGTDLFEIDDDVYRVSNQTANAGNVLAVSGWSTKTIALAS